MTEKQKNLIDTIVSQLANHPYGEVLDVLNEVSVRIYICAPEGSRRLALDDCHEAQNNKLNDFIREKETQKAVVDSAIAKFSDFKRGTEGAN